MIPTARLVAIAVGRVMPLLVPNPNRPDEPNRTHSGIQKTVVSSLDQPDVIELARLGLEGDEQADHTVHGGLDKAVYAYPSEHYSAWRKRRQAAGLTGLGPLGAAGGLGENLSIEGLLEQDVYLGDRWLIGDVELIVRAPREPCAKFNAVMGFKTAAKEMVKSGQSGWYLSVSRPGPLRAGLTIDIIPGSRQLTVLQAFAQRT